jgi:cytochrome c oxidase cbb3-type subunit 1
MNQKKHEALKGYECGEPCGLFVTAAWHSLAWLVTANFVGVLLATLLLFPGLNHWLGEWTYGRWMPVHINLQLYGWCSLPLAAFSMKVYQVDREPAAHWGRAAFWAWSAALAIGSLSWLTGHSSGKLFLDWTGYARIVFPLAIAFLWLLLAWSLRRHWNHKENLPRLTRMLKVAGLGLLFLVPLVLYWSADPGVYPPVNPDTGGPTGASQLESTLAIVAILLLLPFAISRRKPTGRRWLPIAGAVFAAEALVCFALGRGNVSHHRPAQFLNLGSLLLWSPLIPAYYSSFEWARNTRRWRLTWLCWWVLLVPSGWCLFLPGLLDHFKYTDGLVGHALMAMAGFVTSLLIFLLGVLLGEDGKIFDATWAFIMWQASTLGYIAIMLISGWIEGNNPMFALVPGAGRNVIYSVRLVLGSLMTIASLSWFLRASRLAWAHPATVNPGAQMDLASAHAIARAKVI